MRLAITVFWAAAAWGCSPSDDDGATDARPDVRLDATDDGFVPDGVDIPTDGPFACEIGVWGCYGNIHYQCGPDGVSRTNEMPCPEACDPALGCVTCVPNSRRCEGNVSMLCAPDGSAWVTGRDCSEWGSTCGATGYCDDACGEAESTRSYVGCEYWPVALANTAELDSTVFDYRVIVANPNAGPATVHVTRGASEVYTGTVPAGGLTEITLPWISGQSFELPRDEWESIIVADGAYRLRSDLPVTVSQWNPFEYSAGGVFSYTNDATLLYPAHVLTGDYVAVTYVPFTRATGMSGGMIPTPPSYGKYADYVAIVGLAPEPTDVEVWVAGETARERGGRFEWTPPGGTIRFTLQRGEVAHVAAAPPPDCVEGRPDWRREEECTMGMCDFMDTCRETDFDLTGSRIFANRPVEVFGGHVCAYVPYFSQACDHLEEQLAPIQTWGRDFVSAPMTDNGGPGDNMVRVIAAFDGTEITVDPPQDIDYALLDANQWVEFMVWEPFRVSGTKAIQVAQFILGQYYPVPDAERGDPALTVLVPAEQYRSDYTFIAPSSYNAGTNGQSWVMVVRPPGLALTLDGASVSADWRPVAGREIGIVPVAGGTHTIQAAEPFGMIGYGLGSFTSYATPAGLNLNPITILI
ncbi:MAG: IgGFc-binding protein [Deltaproteobacteria bacterium]|nr:IgGFc-binding protein [Deltaproteobacteria bacterium]